MAYNKIDEPGGNQLDNGFSQIINTTGTSSHSQIAESYVGNLSQMNNYYHPYTPSIFTADYALNWFDYKSNYSCIIAEFVGNESRNRIIAQNRGAAAAFQKDWGIIINWKYNQPPHYLESGSELYDDLALAYRAGASYGVVFSYPNLTGTSYGILEEEHFEALQKFWTTLHTNPYSFDDNHAEVAYVLPADYGFGFRSSSDRVWGLLPDGLAAKVYNDVTMLTSRYGAKLDILYDEPDRIEPLLGGYRQVFYWNQTVT